MSSYFRGGEAALFAGILGVVSGSCDDPGQTELIRRPFLDKYATTQELPYSSLDERMDDF